MNKLGPLVLGNLGQIGDQCCNTVVYRLAKLVFPGREIWGQVAEKYSEVLPLFKNQKCVDHIVKWKFYDGWPGPEDQQKIDQLTDSKSLYPCEIRTGMSKQSSRFPNEIHQCYAACLQAQFTDEQIKLLDGQYDCRLNRWFPIYRTKKSVAFAPFAGWYNQHNNKKLSQERAQEIVDFLILSGYQVLQLGGPTEPRLNGAFKYGTDFFHSVQNMLGCDFLLTTDTGLGWYASAYKFPTIGLYSNRDYPDGTIKHIQPMNYNGFYIDEFHVDRITNEQLEEKIKCI